MKGKLKGTPRVTFLAPYVLSSEMIQTIHFFDQMENTHLISMCVMNKINKYLTNVKTILKTFSFSFKINKIFISSYLTTLFTTIGGGGSK